MIRRVCLALAVLLAGCATPERRAPAEPPSPATPPPPSEPAAAALPAAAAPAQAASAPKPACDAFVRPGVLRRVAVVRAVDAGLGRWLAGGVEVTPKLSGGRFQGWIVRRLYPGDPCYAAVDIREGDVVARVNGKSIERPEEANTVFTGLRTARELVVELTRKGEKRTVRLSIVDNGAGGAAAP